MSLQAKLSSVIFLLLATIAVVSSARQLTALVEKQPLTLTYHKGPLLSGPLTVNLLWYGKFTPSQRAIVTDFLLSLSSTSTPSPPPPSVAKWWATVQKYHLKANAPKPTLTLGTQTLDSSCSLGKRLGSRHLSQLASRLGSASGSVNVVLTADDVAVEGFCMSRCGTHGSTKKAAAYIWVGNSAVQCPGQCAWPFHRPIYGPQNPPLVAPNGDVGVDGMVINLATLMAGAVTNPYGDGFYQGEKGAGLEAGSACTGVFGKGAYPGFPGVLLMDSATGGSFNANGVNGRKYLLPALVDPKTMQCATLV